MTRQQIFQVDSFTNVRYSGNPAGVCILEQSVSEQWMQSIAAEMNVAETSFLVPKGDRFHLRWFTPELEVDLCGHATLAAAHILWETEVLSPSSTAIFDTRSGELMASKRGDWIEMDFPAKPAMVSEVSAEILEVFGPEVVGYGRSEFDHIVEFPSHDSVADYIPDITRLAALGGRGVIITSRSNVAEFDFVSRFFGPNAGIPEDPVTGSAHCTLGPYWSEKLRKTELCGRQISARGGTVRLIVRGERVTLIGQAVTTLEGWLV